MSAEEKPKVVKVKPRSYAIEGIMDSQDAKHPLTIVYLSIMGIIAQMDNKLVRVGQFYQINFSVPGGNCNFFGKMRVIKTYDKAIDPRTHKVQRMAEFQFVNLTDEQKANILAFAKAHGQK